MHYSESYSSVREHYSLSCATPSFRASSRTVSSMPCSKLSSTGFHPSFSTARLASPRAFVPRRILA